MLKPSQRAGEVVLCGEITPMVSSGVWCPAAQRHGCVFWKTFRALLSDSDSGRPPVANERFSHSFSCALKCQRKCPSDSNYRCYLGATAALLLNTWNWQQSGWKKGIGYSASPSSPASLALFICSRIIQMNLVPLPPSVLILPLKHSCSLLKHQRI